MSTTHDKRNLDERAEILQRLYDDCLDDLLYERRVRLPRLERHAVEALARPAERFIGEKRIARMVLDIDLPQSEFWIDSALSIVQFGDHRSKALFVLASPAERDAMVLAVQRAGGVSDERRKWHSL